MNRTGDIKVGNPITVDKRATGTVSGTFDALGCAEVLAYVVKSSFSSKGSKQILRIRHCSASTTLYASATAFSTPVIASSTAGSASELQGPFLIDMAGKSRHLRFLLSNATASATSGVIANGCTNEKSSALSSVFVSLTGVKSAPNNP